MNTITYQARCPCGRYATYTTRDVSVTHYNPRGDVIHLDEVRTTIDCRNPRCREGNLWTY